MCSSGLKKRLLFSLLFVSIMVATVNSQEGTPNGVSIPKIELDNLVQGRVYSRSVYRSVKGNPFLTQNWVLGDVRLQEQEYQGLPLWYDIFLDEVVFLNRTFSGLQLIRLNKSYLKSFNLGNREFINSSYGRFSNAELEKGYFEVIFEDKISLLVKRNLDVKTEDAVATFDRKDRWYLIKSGKSFRIRGKKNFLAAIGESHKKEMSSFLKKQRINLRKADDAKWILVGLYLNELIENNQ